MEEEKTLKCPAKFVTIRDLAQQTHLIGTMIRVIGILDTYNVVSSRMLIQDWNHSTKLLLDVSNIEPFLHYKGCLCQLIGELDKDETETLLLRVLVYRYVNELNMTTYEEAHFQRTAQLMAQKNCIIKRQ